ncbi:MAG: AI-2E family transporter [Akkermansia sp.]|nr:AI-2E family transporter [Akkermansia sp.]
MQQDDHQSPLTSAPARPRFPGEGTRFLVAAAAAVVLILGMRVMGQVVSILLMGAFLAIISYPITTAARTKLRFPHWLAVATTVVVDLGVILAIYFLLNFLAADIVTTLRGDVTQKFVERFEQMREALLGIAPGLSDTPQFRTPSNMLGAERVIGFVQGLSVNLASTLSAVTLVLVLMTFMLGEAPLFYRNLQRLPNSKKGKENVVRALQGIQRYLLIKSIASFFTGLLAWGLCSAMGVPFAFLWGVLAWVLNYIPTIGSIVAAVPPILLALLFSGWGDVVIVGLGYLGINMAIGNGIEPLFLGKQFGIATTVVVLSVIFWGWVLGPCGMFLAVPISVLIKLALENSRDLSWLATMLDDKGAADNKPTPSSHHSS